MKEMGFGRDYRYAHDEPDAYAAGERYLPTVLGVLFMLAVTAVLLIATDWALTTPGVRAPMTAMALKNNFADVLNFMWSSLACYRHHCALPQTGVSLTRRDQKRLTGYPCRYHADAATNRLYTVSVPSATRCASSARAQRRAGSPYVDSTFSARSRN